jgi:hypothetical protein
MMARPENNRGILIWITADLSYLIIFLVLAVALAPLSHFLPSKAQRKTARMRELAAIQGMFVEFRESPLRPGRAARERGQTIYYGRRAPGRGRRGPLKRIVWALQDDTWVAVPRGEPVPGVLSEFSANISAVSVDQDSCGIYWQERGDEAEVEQISRILSRLAGELYQ